jgi:type IX secretion system PorP/SprF family membrane protein
VKQLLFLLLVITCTSARAQQDPVFSLLRENQLFFNPAYAGVEKFGMLNLSGRDQWQDADKNPETYYVSWDMHLDSLNNGIGIVAAHDRKGLETTNHIGLNYSYRINVAAGYLRLGIQAAAYRKSIDFSGLNSPVAAGLPGTKQAQVKPDADLGIWYYVSHKYFIGLSVRHIPQVQFERLNYDMARHYYLISGYSVPVSAASILKATVLVNSDLTSTAADLNLRIIYNGGLTLGGSYRPNNTNRFMIHTGVRVFESFALSFAYEFPHAILGPSMEANLKYYFRKKAVPAPKKSIKLKPLDEE